MLRADIFSGFLIARVTSFAKTLKYILLPTGTSICGKNNLEPEKSNSVIPSDACLETLASMNEERSLKPSFLATLKLDSICKVSPCSRILPFSRTTILSESLATSD